MALISAHQVRSFTAGVLGCSLSGALARAQDAPAPDSDQRWNFHIQNTVVVQGDPAFPAKYSGPNSLNDRGQTQETVTLDLFAGARLWRGAELHADGLVWQGFGLSQTYGIESFPNGDAYKAGTHAPNFTFAHLFVRQAFGLGGGQEAASDDQLALAGRQDISRFTVTVGRFTPKDLFDDNAYANDPHRQFMNWSLMANTTWDYGQNTVGYTTGIALDLNQPGWAVRYAFFQMPRDKNGFTGDDQWLMWPRRGAYGPFLRAWAMSTEAERRYTIGGRPGTIRVMPWLDEADMATYLGAIPILREDGVGANLTAARAYRYKYGIGLSWDQQVVKSVGVFSRLGWCDGREETWTFTDIDELATLGTSVTGEAWRRPHDTFGLAGIVGAASKDNQEFLAAGGTDMLDGDGRLNYGPEKVLETYYDIGVWKTVHVTLDYQYVVNPAFNRDRGPVPIFGARLHWEL
jgi:high affinity Mn2+ porin